MDKYKRKKTSWKIWKLENSSDNKHQFETMVFQTFVNKNAIVTDSFETAKQSNKWSLWTKGNFAELDSIIENGVFEIVQKESQDKDKTLINTQWVLYKKTWYWKEPKNI